MATKLIGYPISDPFEVLPYAHCSKPIFQKMQLVYLAKGADEAHLRGWEHDDRLMGWDYTAWSDGITRATGSGAERRTAQWWEEVLRGYYKDDGLKLRAVMTGFKLHNGHEYYAFSYVRSKGQ